MREVLRDGKSPLNENRSLRYLVASACTNQQPYFQGAWPLRMQVSFIHLDTIVVGVRKHYF